MQLQGPDSNRQLSVYETELLTIASPCDRLENVRFELRLMLPRQACYHYTTFSIINDLAENRTLISGQTVRCNNHYTTRPYIFHSDLNGDSVLTRHLSYHQTIEAKLFVLRLQTNVTLIKALICQTYIHVPFNTLVLCVPLRWLYLHNSELLDLLFDLKRVVRTLLMSTCSIKQVHLASSPVPHYITAVDLTHFHSEPLLTFAFGDFYGSRTHNLFLRGKLLYPLS